MGGIISKPKIPKPSEAELRAQAEARQAQAEEKRLLTEKQADEDRLRIEEMRDLQARRRGQRYGGRRSLLSPLRLDAEMGVGKKTTLGG